MTTTKMLSCILMGAAMLAAGWASVNAQSIEPETISGGGGEASSASHVINGTIGQTASSTVTSASNEIDQGLWPAVGLRGTIAHAAGTRWEVIGGGGGEASSASHVITGTLSQTADVVIASASSELAQGFWLGEPDLPLYRVVEREFVPETPMVRGVSEGSTSSLSVAPEPIDGLATVTLSVGVEGYAELELFDATGGHRGMVYEGWLAAGETRILLDGRELAAGSYFLRLGIDGRTAVTRRIVIVR